MDVLFDPSFEFRIPERLKFLTDVGIEIIDDILPSRGPFENPDEQIGTCPEHPCGLACEEFGINSAPTMQHHMDEDLGPWLVHNLKVFPEENTQRGFV